MSVQQDKTELINELESLAKTIKMNKDIFRQRRPIVIEFCGSPKSGKTSCINSLSLFLKRNNFKTQVITERASTCNVSDKKSPIFNISTSFSTIVDLLSSLYSERPNYDVIIIDRGIFDALCWFSWLHSIKRMDSHELSLMSETMLFSKWAKCIDLVYAFTATPEKSIEREYANLLTKQEGTIMNFSTLREFEIEVKETVKKYKTKFHQILEIDTSELGQNSVNYIVTKTVLDELNSMLMEKIAYYNMPGTIPWNEGSDSYSQYASFFTQQIQFSTRQDVENANQLQPLPIAVITDKDRKKILVLKKKIAEVGKYSPERNKLLLYAGGHIRQEDAMPDHDNSKFLELAESTLKREISEELGISLSLDGIEPFIIYTPTYAEKSRKHVAICYVIELNELESTKFILDPVELVVKSGKSKSGTIIDISSLLDIKDINLESWSIEILKVVFHVSSDELKKLSDKSYNPDQLSM